MPDRRKHKIHGLKTRSARHPLQHNDTYVGMHFRLLHGYEAIKAYIGEFGFGADRPEKERRIEEDKLAEGYHLLTWAAILSDGVSNLESGFDSMIIDLRNGQDRGEDDWEEVKHIAQRVCRDSLMVAEGKTMVFQIFAVSEPLPAVLKNCPLFLPSFYQHLNAIPFLIPSPTLLFDGLPDPTSEYFAQNAVKEAIKYLSPAIHSAVVVSANEHDQTVEVDAGGLIHIACLDYYQQSTSPKLWRRFRALVRHVIGNDITLCRLSATPQGGGVALLQNALVRLWKLVGIDGKWAVPYGHPRVFAITKMFHNILQGVAEPQQDLMPDQKKNFQGWIQTNYNKFWLPNDDYLFNNRIIVIDDPQLTALIPLIKKKRPDAKIIFRSHIQIESNLVDKGDTPQAHVWDYLFDFVKQADLFIAHPVEHFVPQNVKDHMPILYMPPATDPLDGLNKPLGREAMHHLREAYNHISLQQCGVAVDWSRGYIVQVARFDPSKGIPDLLAAYLDFRKRLEEAGMGKDKHGKKPPMLVVVGHGSVDDPDGTRIYESAHSIVQSKGYELVTEDVSIVRAPPSDTLLGCLMQGAWCATQLSTREGFEVKVSEAILKRIPIIATTAGGIPLQVQDGINGWLVPPNDPTRTADKLFAFYTKKIKLDRPNGRPSTGRRRRDSLHFSREQQPGASTTLTRPDSRRVSFTSEPEELDGDPIDNDSGLVGDGLDPNTAADRFVTDIGAPFPAVHPDSSSPSEDFFTVGNAARWLLIISLMSGKAVNPAHHTARNDGDGEDDIQLLESMGLSRKGTVGGQEAFHEFNNRSVWKMLMGEDAEPGDGSIIWNDPARSRDMGPKANGEPEKNGPSELEGRPL